MDVQSVANPTLILIPTYNEAKSIEAVVREALDTIDCDVLILDDNSPDGTGQIADRLRATNGRVKVAHRAGKDGLGAAYRAGFAFALEHGYSRIVQMDGDGSHDASALPALIDALDHYDLAVGSRWVRAGRVENWPWLRQATSRLGSVYARTLLRLPVKDATSGMKAWRSELLSSIGPDTVGGNGYVFQIEMTHRANELGARITEVPIRFVERTLGESKFSIGIVAEAILRVTMLRMRVWRRRMQAR
jgi:dolichol-phosphate mannosyltransferase